MKALNIKRRISLCFCSLIIGIGPLNTWATGPQKMVRKVAQEDVVVLVSVEDVVYKLDKISDGYRVLFKTHAGVYYLKNNSKNFDSLLQALQSSRDSGSKLTLKSDATLLEIKELVLKAE